MDPVPIAETLDPPGDESRAEDKHRAGGPPPPTTTTHATEELTKIVAGDLVGTNELIVMGREESMVVMGREENAVMVRPEEGTIVMRIGPSMSVMVIGRRDETPEATIMRRGEVLHLDGTTAMVMTSPMVNVTGARVERQHGSNSYMLSKGGFLDGSSWRNLTAIDGIASRRESCFTNEGVKS